jgi:cytochrome P450
VAPGRLPLIGHLWPLWRRPIEFICGLRPPGGVVRVDVGRWPVYLLTEPELVHQVLVTKAHDFERARIFKHLRKVVGDGVIASDGELHRRQRRMILPAFHHRHLDAYAQVMSETARAVADSWRPSQVIELDQEMYRLSITTLAKAIFSSSLTPAAVTELCDAVPIVTASMIFRAVTPSPVTALPLPVNRRFNAAVTSLCRIADDIITRRRENGEQHDDLLSTLLSTRDPDTGEPMSDAEVRDQFVSFMLVGTDTTANTLTWAFYELARHPHILQRVEAEVDAVIGVHLGTDIDAAEADSGGAGPVSQPVVRRHVAELDYTNRVLTEVLRMHSLLLVTRRTTSPVQIGSAMMPTATEVAYSLHALNHDPRLHPEPGCFDPDRWLPDHGRSRPGAPSSPSEPVAINASATPSPGPRCSSPWPPSPRGGDSNHPPEPPSRWPWRQSRHPMPCR